MHLEDIFRNIRAHGRYHGPLIRTRGDYDIGGFNSSVICRKQITSGVRSSLQGSDFDTTARRSVYEGRIVLDEPNDLTTGREGVWIVRLILESGCLNGPVGKLKAEGIPAFAAPTFAHSAPFENYMFSSQRTERIAHCEAGVTAADDDGINLLVHGDLL